MRCVCRLPLNWHLSKFSCDQAGLSALRGRPQWEGTVPVTSHGERRLPASLLTVKPASESSPFRRETAVGAPPLCHCSPTLSLLPGMAKKWAMRGKGPTSAPRATP